MGYGPTGPHLWHNRFSPLPSGWWVSPASMSPRKCAPERGCATLYAWSLSAVLSHSRSFCRVGLEVRPHPRISFRRGLIVSRKFFGDPLRCGDLIAWVMKNRSKRTAGVSAKHRVQEDGKTYCNHAVPAEASRLPPFRSLDRCRRCESLHARALDYLKANGRG